MVTHQSSVFIEYGIKCMCCRPLGVVLAIEWQGSWNIDNELYRLEGSLCHLYCFLVPGPWSEVGFCFSGHKLAHINLGSKLAFRQYR